MKHWLVIAGVVALAAAAADYTIPKTWTRTGPEYARAATHIFDPLNTDLPVRVSVRVKQVSGDDRIDGWTAESVAALPDMVTNSVNGQVTTNMFKVRMLPIFTRNNIVAAYNWSLVDGRESSMLPAPPVP